MLWRPLPDCDTATSVLQVLLRGRVHTVRGKGKSCFLVLRQRTSTIQVGAFYLDKHFHKQMRRSLQASRIVAQCIPVQQTLAVAIPLLLRNWKMDASCSYSCRWHAVPANVTCLPVILQLVLFADEKVVSKGMVKYASSLPRESVTDVEGIIFVPEHPVQGCTHSSVRLLSSWHLLLLSSMINAQCIVHNALH